MTATIVLAAALSFAPAQSAGLNVTNIRHTFRDLGASRPDTIYLPGDVVFIAFDIEGLKMTEEGKVGYIMGMDVLDKAGKAILNAPPSKSEMVLPLGGNKLPAHVFVALGPEMVSGAYRCKVSIADASGGPAKIAEQAFTVQPMNFGMVSLFVSYDERANMPSGMTGVVGQTVFVNFGLVGFGRDSSKKPNAAVEFRILENGRPTIAKPMVAALPRDLKEDEQFVPFQFPVALNREGNFTVELKAVDKISNKTATMTFPIRVNPASK